MKDLSKLSTEKLLDKYYDIEYDLDDMLNIRNLQDAEDDEEYHKQIDKLFEKRRAYIEELKARKLDCMIANCQADLFF